MIFYTDFGVPEGSAGCARGPLIFIRPEYRDDVGLREHEWTHVKQWFRTLGLHSLLYLFCWRYRFNAEVEAYKVQASYYPDVMARLVRFAKFIAEDYRLPISETDALKRLTA